MSFHDHIGWQHVRAGTARSDVRPSSPIGREGRIAAILLLAAVVLRFGQFGNPLAGLDEQFYLLVGDRMWHGELPYVDLWDRKPFGLFLLFAAIRMLPGDGVLTAQLVATACAAATAWQATVIARRCVASVPATLAGIFYLAGLGMLWGDTTQTPVFYNLLVVIAARLTLDAAGAWAGSARPRLRGAIVAMTLIGVAIQIKTNALFEGAAFAAWMLAMHWRQYREGAGAMRLAIVFAGVAAAPTLAAMAFFALDGQFAAWWQANVLSILAKRGGNDVTAMASLRETIVLTTPIVALMLFGLWRRTERFRRWSAETVFLVVWIAATLVDFLAIGGYYPHYAIPLLLAGLPLIAHGFAVPRGKLVAAVMLIAPTGIAVAVQPRVGAAERRNAAAVVDALPADVRTRCLFIYEGPVAYYGLTHACRVSRFAFTGHLGSIREAPALGVDAAVALDEAMERRPGTVVTLAHSTFPLRNRAIEARLNRWLLRDYRLTRVLPHKQYAPEERLLIWRRANLVGATPAAAMPSAGRRER